VSPRNVPPPASSDEIAQLRDEVTDLKNQVQVLSDILDEIREELQWVTRNGLPIREPLPACPTLKRMALDPCADDWNERLVIDYGPLPRAASSTSAGHSQETIPSENLVASAGSQRQLF
jgi:hypothetical protein